MSNLSSRKPFNTAALFFIFFLIYNLSRMIATSHLIIGGSVGALVGTVTGNPAAALAAGFVSHLICDALPHWDHPDAPKIGTELVWTKAVWIFAILDSSFGGILTLLIWAMQYNFDITSPFVWGAAGGYLPDFIDNMPFWKLQLRKLKMFQLFHDLHLWIHHIWQWRFPMPKYRILGTITQLAVVIPSLWYIFHK